MSGPVRPAVRPDYPEAFARSVLDGLARPQKRLESKWLYDAEGSRLFDRICRLEEYYPTVTETGILRRNAVSLRNVIPPGSALVELGSGSSTKTRILLDALPDLGVYVPVDISAGHLAAASRRLSADYPALEMHPLAADFTAPIVLPEALRTVAKLLFFPGSTIGNFTVMEAQALLARLRRLPGVAGFVIGADLRKDVDRLLRAYDDRDGVTAQFNLNLLSRINRELDGSFELACFAHAARWNEAQSRIEMHLVSDRRQTVDVAGEAFGFDEGETIHTENSHKFSIDGFGNLARDAGWAPTAVWTDPERLFSVHVLVPDQAAGG